MSEILGWNAVVAGLASVVIGLAHQIVKNYRRKSCEGFSLVLAAFMFYPYVSWLAYGISTQNIFLCIPQSLGSACMLVIFFQFWLYRKPREKNARRRNILDAI